MITGMTELAPLTANVTEDHLLTAAEVAELLNVAVSWVSTAAREGVLPCVRVGRWIRFRRPSILEWVDQLEQPGRSIRSRSVFPTTKEGVS